MAATPLVELHEVGRRYQRGASVVRALHDVSLSIQAGEMVSIIGPSGSGKSTLLAIVGCLDRATEGRCVIEGRSTETLTDVEMSRLRNATIGFVFQSFHLIPRLSVVENVETPLLYSRIPAVEWRPRALASLERVGLSSRAEHFPHELSGGEAQRVAMARALVVDPRLILADEPTGNLDRTAAEEIATLLETLHQAGRTVILVTHNEDLAHRAGRVISLRDGRIAREERHGA